MACGNCQGFIEKHVKMDSVSPLSTQFSQQCILSSCEEHTHVVFYEGGVGHISQKNCYGEPPPSIDKNNQAICRGIPVKETTHLKRGQNAEGKKMINEYVREHKIGSGSYGKVVLYQSSSGKPFAIKALSKSRLSRVRVAPAETAMTDVLREVSIMKRLEHQNIVNLIEVIDDPEADRFYMVLEYVEGKWVCDSAGTPGGIGEGCARKYFRDIIAGVMYLHAHNIIHGDIKPENLLVTKSGRVKIGDFSVSNAFEGDNEELWRTPGTPAFTAPECCLGSTYHGKAADTWAVGVTLYCMILGSCPFMGDCLQDTYERIISCHLSLPEKLDHELKDLLRGLLCRDPMQRITLDVAASHPWVVRDGGPVCQTSCRCKEKMDIVDSVALA